MRAHGYHVDDPVEVGRRIRERREAQGISQRRLAFPGCSPAYISRIESGGRIPSLQVIVELARRLDSTPEYLARGDKHGDSLASVLFAALREARPYVYNRLCENGWRGETANGVLGRVDAAIAAGREAKL